MHLYEFQEQAADTLLPECDDLGYLVLELNEEAGEVAGKLKRAIREHGGVVTPKIRTEVIRELGDVLWAVATLATKIRASLELVAAMNLGKLRSRKDRGVLTGKGDNR